MLRALSIIPAVLSAAREGLEEESENGRWSMIQKAEEQQEDFLRTEASRKEEEEEDTGHHRRRRLHRVVREGEEEQEARQQEEDARNGENTRTWIRWYVRSPFFLPFVTSGCYICTQINTNSCT